MAFGISKQKSWRIINSLRHSVKEDVGRVEIFKKDRACSSLGINIV